MDHSPTKTPFSISPSTISAFVSCPKKFNYKYIKELQPKVKTSTKYFDKGNYFHELSHVYYELIKAGATPGSQFCVAYIRDRVQSDMQHAKQDDFPVYASILKTMLRFISEQSPKIDRGITVLDVESNLSYTVGEVEFFGYADLIYMDEEGRHRVRDHKTGEKVWTQGDAKFSNQLMFYAFIYWKNTGHVPYSEISFANTHEYKDPRPTADTFQLTKVLYTEKELLQYYEDICNLAEHMLECPPFPHYTQLCNMCAFQQPCFMERKGVDPESIIQQNFNVVPREKHHGRFTEDNATDDKTD